MFWEFYFPPSDKTEEIPFFFYEVNLTSFDNFVEKFLFVGYDEGTSPNRGKITYKESFMKLQTYLKDKMKGLIPLAVAVVLSVVGVIVYASVYGAASTNMKVMSWEAFALFIAAIVFALGLTAICQGVFGALASAVCTLIGFLLYIYKMNTYISAAFTGIDSTWEAPFFIVTICFVGALAASIVSVCMLAGRVRGLQKGALTATSVLLGVVMTGSVIANENAAAINSALDIETYRVETNEDDDGNYEYFPSRYQKLADLIKDGQELGERAMGEGVVLLKNENNALPMKDGKKVSLFSISCVDPAYGGTGSGLVDVSTAPTYKQAFERNGLFSVNPTLWNWYSSDAQSGYKRQTGTTGPGVKGIKVMGEAPWNEVESANGSTFAEYGDAAIVVLARLGGEGSDMPRGDRSLSTLDDVDGALGDSTNGDYLKLSPKEKDLLAGLKAKKDAGVFKKVIVLLNTANQIEADFLNDSAYGIDACLWIGTPGQTGLYAVADIIAGNVNPSGSLSTTFWRTHDQNPTLANFGVSTYQGAPDAVNTDGSPQQDKVYVVYQEGIYLGYRYTETRYEDYVMNTENVGAYDYAKTVSYPFGYGQSYSTFEYSGFKVEKSGFGADVKYTVSVTVTNKGPYDGKESVQIYLQKPYGSYNKANGVEASAVDLVGFGKTDLLKVGEKQTVSVVIDERQFASYDSNKAKTYVVTEGDYYLTVGTSAHDATNNILAKKGYTPSSTNGRMDDAGAPELVSSAIHLGFDGVKYSASEATDYTITNQFDYADFNKYENKGSDSVTYTSRKDWVGTTPSSWDDGVVLHWRDQIAVDEDATGRQGETTVPEDNGEYPVFGKTGDIKLKLIDMRVDADGNKIPYGDPVWNQLLDQLTWEEMANVITYGMRMSGAIESIDKMQVLDHNGPSGLTQKYSAGKSGLATRLDDPDKEARAMCYPSGGILAASMNVDLMYEIGDMIGEDAIWAGYGGLYGPGSNIQRTPYSGRNFEYYSEDGFLSGMICAYECAAMESHGLYVYNKHCALNDQEDLRRGICTWANEQSIREIYMKAFELPITIAGTQYEFKGETVTLKGASGVMTAFNRLGLHWAGQQKGLITNFLRNECGMDGIVVTDMWYGTASPYMNLPQMLLAGTNLIDGRMDVAHLDASKTNHADVAWAMRESIHHILYTVVHSAAMNGISPNAKIVQITPWWKTLLTGLEIGLGVLVVASAAWIVVDLIRRKNY